MFISQFTTPAGIDYSVPVNVRADPRIRANSELNGQKRHVGTPYFQSRHLRLMSHTH